MEAILQPQDLQYASQNIIASRLRNLKSLEIANHDQLTDEEFQKLLLNCPDLLELTLQNCPQLTHYSLQFLTQVCPFLHSLQWIGQKNTPSGCFESLALIPKLQSLNLSSSSLTAPACQSLLNRPCPLTYLDVSFCPLTDEAFANVRAPLRFLNLQGCSLLTDTTLRHLSKIPTLRHLCLAYNSHMTPSALSALPHLSIHIPRNFRNS